jgi:Winged helix DNA-binding domain
MTHRPVLPVARARAAVRGDTNVAAVCIDVGRRSILAAMDAPVITRRELNRATLARQLLLERSTMSIPAAIEHLVGLQAQTPHTAYTGLWSRLEAFAPEALSELIVGRRVVRLALMRGTIHMVTARDAWGLRPLVQPVLDRVQKSQFGKRLVDVDLDAVVAAGRAFVDAEPRTFKALGDHLLERWPGRDRFALEQTIRTAIPLIQVPPRGLWGRSGPIAHTSIRAWLGAPSPEPVSLDALVTRYLGAFGPASVMDAQAWCGLTRLADVFAGLRPGLLTFRDESGRELFDLPDAPRPDPDVTASPRFLYDFDNLLLSHADRTRMISTETADAVRPATQEPVSTFTLDGFVAGTWRIEREKPRGAATLTLRPIRPLARRQAAALTDEGARLLAFVAAESTEHRIRVERR